MNGRPPADRVQNSPGTGIILIRHAESEGNVGLPTDMPETIRLTPKGHRQAAALAAQFTEAPGLIVTSSYVRTQETAAPLIALYPEVPVVVWPVHEFTYLNPLKYRGTTQDQRAVFARSYWRSCDARWNDGGGAESFFEFIARIDDFTCRLRACAAPSIVVFSHGYFIMGLQLRFHDPCAPVDDRLMAGFRDRRRINPPRNGSRFTVLPEHLRRHEPTAAITP